MNEEVLKAVLSEILEEQKMLNINNGLITKSVEDFFEKLSDLRINYPIQKKVPEQIYRILIQICKGLKLL